MGRRFTFRLGLLSACLFFHSVAQAHWHNNRGFHGWYLGTYLPYYGYSSTAAGSYLLGLGAYFDGLGRLNANNAIAAQHFQQAYEHWLKNSKRRVQTYYEMRDIHDQWIKAHRHPPLTKEQLTILSKSRLPNRLLPGQWDASQGHFRWPYLLNTQSFEAARLALEALFIERERVPGESGLGTRNCLEVKAIVEEMRAGLKKIVSQVPADDYIAATRLLRSIAYEARFQAGE